MNMFNNEAYIEISNDINAKNYEFLLEQRKLINNLKQAYIKNEALSGIVKKCLSDGTLILDLGYAIQGEIPREEVTYLIEEDGNVHLGVCRNLVGEEIKFVIKEIETNNNDIVRFVLSRKSYVLKVRDNLIKTLRPGQVIEGVVSGIQKYAAFLNFPGDIAGIISVGDIVPIYVKDPSEVLRKGDKVKARIITITYDENMKLVLERKSLLPGWQDIDEYIRKGETHIGIVKNMAADGKGIHIVVGDWYQGIADLPSGMKVHYGDKVKVTIERIDKSRERIRLRIV